MLIGLNCTSGSPPNLFSTTIVSIILLTMGNIDSLILSIVFNGEMVATSASDV